MRRRPSNKTDEISKPCTIVNRVKGRYVLNNLSSLQFKTELGTMINSRVHELHKSQRSIFLNTFYFFCQPSERIQN